MDKNRKCEYFLVFCKMNKIDPYLDKNEEFLFFLMGLTFT